MTKVRRTTKETKITIDLSRGDGDIDVDVPDAFFGHMLQTLARYAKWDLRIKAESLDGIDHHVIEDVAISVGRAVAQLAEEASVARFGHAVVVMDDALVAATIDVGGRAYYEGELPMPMMEHALRSLVFEARSTLHLEVRRGREAHHITEAAFKATGMALAEALVPAEDTQSTKGDVRYGQ